jgi:tetratricopeptide (TPR) repeat protein
MVAFYLAIPAIQARARPEGAARPGQVREDPDELYKGRADLALAARARAIWTARAAAGPDFEAQWKIARVCYWLGTHLPERERRAALEAGVGAGRVAAAMHGDRPEGLFWMAANMGALAESFGLRQGLKYRGSIKAALERVLAIDPAWQQGSADRALGRWYFKVPGLFGGSDRKAEEHLRRALAYNPNSTATLVFLAEVLIEDGRKDEARHVLQRAIDAPYDPDWGPEDRSFKQHAQKLLGELKIDDLVESSIPTGLLVLVEPFA